MDTNSIPSEMLPEHLVVLVLDKSDVLLLRDPSTVRDWRPWRSSASEIKPLRYQAELPAR
jgi:hypothetical protein